MVENKRRTESKQMILSAFEKKLAAVDYKNIKINDLCDDALIGKRTFYRCFRDLDDLLDTYIYHHLSQFFNLFDPGEAVYASAKEYFTAVFTAVYKNESQFFLTIENNKLWEEYRKNRKQDKNDIFNIILTFQNSVENMYKENKERIIKIEEMCPNCKIKTM